MERNATYVMAGCHMEDERNVSGSTYFIQPRDGGLIKIGFSKSPMTRLKQLQTGSPVPLVLIAIFDGNVEDDLHWRFHRCRKHGEWFEPTEELISFMKNRCRKTGHWRKAFKMMSEVYSHTDTSIARDTRRTMACSAGSAAAQRKTSYERRGDKSVRCANLRPTRRNNVCAMMKNGRKRTDTT